MTFAIGLDTSTFIFMVRSTCYNWIPATCCPRLKIQRERDGEPTATRGSNSSQPMGESAPWVLCHQKSGTSWRARVSWWQLVWEDRADGEDLWWSERYLNVYPDVYPYLHPFYNLSISICTHFSHTFHTYTHTCTCTCTHAHRGKKVWSLRNDVV